MAKFEKGKIVELNENYTTNSFKDLEYTNIYLRIKALNPTYLMLLKKIKKSKATYFALIYENPYKDSIEIKINNKKYYINVNEKFSLLDTMVIPTKESVEFYATIADRIIKNTNESQIKQKTKKKSPNIVKKTKAVHTSKKKPNKNYKSIKHEHKQSPSRVEKIKAQHEAHLKAIENRENYQKHIDEYIEHLEKSKKRNSSYSSWSVNHPYQGGSFN